MTPDYKVFNNYDPNASVEVVFPNYVPGKLTYFDKMLGYLNLERFDLYEQVVELLCSKLTSGLEESDSERVLTYYAGGLANLPTLSKNQVLSDLSLRFVLSQLDIPIDFSMSEKEEKVEVTLVAAQKAENIILYHALTTLVDLLGRDAGLGLYKDFVDFLAKNPPEQKLKDFKEARETWVADMASSGGLLFAVHDFDENKFLAKFDKCYVHESLKDMDDPELAYYIACYIGGTVCNERDWCVRMRRTQTLFTGDYCDEFYWNREVHDEPEQPSLEFSAKLVTSSDEE